jgi:hypothetical protein
MIETVESDQYETERQSIANIYEGFKVQILKRSLDILNDNYTENRVKKCVMNLIIVVEDRCN